MDNLRPEMWQTLHLLTFNQGDKKMKQIRVTPFHTILNTQDIEKLLELSKKEKNPHIYPSVLLFATLGLRVAELIELRREDFNPIEKKLFVRQGCEFGIDRPLPITDEICNALSDYLKTHDSEYMFPSMEGRKNCHTVLNRRIKRFSCLYPLGKKWAPQSLRNSFAINYLNQGGDPDNLVYILAQTNLKRIRKEAKNQLSSKL